MKKLEVNLSTLSRESLESILNDLTKNSTQSWSDFSEEDLVDAILEAQELLKEGLAI